ncbi:hypothetical protein OK016_21130 [Vibrio chagasii]|nr:hypothetical protein [Vibrio chagasii]
MMVELASGESAALTISLVARLAADLNAFENSVVVKVDEVVPPPNFHWIFWRLLKAQWFTQVQMLTSLRVSKVRCKQTRVLGKQYQIG